MRFFLTLVLCLSFHLVGSDYQLSPTPQWVNHQGFNKLNLNKSINHPLYYKVYENQIYQVDDYQSYFRKVISVNSQESLQYITHLNIDFFNAYQTLHIHAIEVIRSDKSISQLNKNQIRMLNSEDELANNVYTGKVRFNLLLEDIRVGDDILIEYTIKGKNPVFKNKFFEELPLQFGMYTDTLLYQVFVPKNKTLNYKLHGHSTVTAEKKINSDLVHFSWQFTGQEPYLVDEYFPKDRVPYHWLQLSEFNSWEEVASWASNLFYTPKLFSDSLYDSRSSLDYQRAIREWIGRDQADTFSISDDALAYSIRNNLRYTSASEGVYSHLASDPIDSLKRGYADCKDKVNIFLSYVNSSIQVRSLPALVSTRFGHDLNNWLPTPNAFDHAIVLARDRNDNERWIDLTQPIKEQYLENQAEPDFGYALLLQTQQTPLIKMHSGAKQRHVYIEEKIDLSESQGNRGIIKAQFTFYENDAMAIRQAHYESTEALRIDFEKLYQQVYPNIVLTDLVINLDDNTPKVQVSVTLEAAIGDFWLQDLDKRVLTVYPLQLSHILSGTIESSRTIATAINGPVEYGHNTQVVLPFKIQTPLPDVNLENSFYEFKQKVRVLNNTIQYESLYRGKLATLEPQLINEFNHAQKQLIDSLGVRYFVNVDNVNEATVFSAKKAHEVMISRQQTPNILLLVLLTISILSAVYWSIKFIKYRTAKYTNDEIDMTYNGFFGSLLLVTIGLIIYFIISLGFSLATIPLFFSSTWQTLTAPSNALYHSLWQLLVPLTAIGEVTTLVILTFVLALFFMKKEASKGLMLIVLSIKVVISVSALALIYRIGQKVGAENIPQVFHISVEMMLFQVAVLVFIAVYFKYSRHIKHTIVC